ncbi:hypothetical protein JQR85_04545 [Stutzerimonas urumqiensis]|uniref:hypothetical protein n=1 Tax=Stutzerimonas urumqiensis TaxID=638269 RepID=UPI003DA4B360
MKLGIWIALVGLSLTLQAQAGDRRDGVWIYQAGDGFTQDRHPYRASPQPPRHRYDPRSPYPHYPRHRNNLPPDNRHYVPPQFRDRYPAQRDYRRPRWDDDRHRGWRAAPRDRGDWRHDWRNDGRYDRRPDWRSDQLRPRHDYRPLRHSVGGGFYIRRD